MPVGCRVPSLAGRDGRDGHQRVAAIEIGELFGEADHDPLGAGVFGDIAPEILAGLQDLEPECVEHVVCAWEAASLASILAS